MRRTILWHAVTGLVLSGLVTLSSGCRKELCYNHDEHAYSVKVDVTAPGAGMGTRPRQGMEKYLGRQGMEQLDDVRRPASRSTRGYTRRSI